MQNQYKAAPCAIFDARIITFFSDLSDEILKNPGSKRYPELISFGFWCRKASLIQMKRMYDSNTIRMGRGIVFHIAPSNVPLNFAYSLAAGLLSGNANIVRLPAKKWEQAELLKEYIEQTLQKETHQWLKPYIQFVQYEKESGMTDEYSKCCDIRVIWGGDETIAQIRKSAIPAKAYDITFADRCSFCLINAAAYLQTEDREKQKLTGDFYNDTYLSDQNACTSPYLVLWQGTEQECGEARKVFWEQLYKIVKEKYILHEVNAVDKWVTFLKAAALGYDVQKIEQKDHLLFQVELSSLEAGLEELRCGCGYFYEYCIQSLDEIFPIINQKYQTMSYYGIDLEQFQQKMMHWGAVGIDRVVPIGKTMDFALIWDGYDLIRLMSRQVTMM